jgi:hypothetical protein
MSRTPARPRRPGGLGHSCAVTLRGFSDTPNGWALSASRSRRLWRSPRRTTFWAELTVTEEFRFDETFRVEHRLRRLHDLGFGAAEMDLVTSSHGANLRSCRAWSSAAATSPDCTGSISSASRPAAWRSTRSPVTFSAAMSKVKAALPICQRWMYFAVSTSMMYAVSEPASRRNDVLDSEQLPKRSRRGGVVRAARESVEHSLAEYGLRPAPP